MTNRLRYTVRPSVVLLLEDAQGAYMAVRFPSAKAAREWEDEHDLSHAARGTASYVSDHEALKRMEG